MKRINNSNLLLLVINGLCPGRTKHSNYRGPNPTEIKYNVSLPCYIATKNSYKRKSYMKCFAEADAVRFVLFFYNLYTCMFILQERKLNYDLRNCGGNTNTTIH